MCQNLWTHKAREFGRFQQYASKVEDISPAEEGTPPPFIWRDTILEDIQYFFKIEAIGKTDRFTNNCFYLNGSWYWRGIFPVKYHEIPQKHVSLPTPTPFFHPMTPVWDRSPTHWSKYIYIYTRGRKDRRYYRKYRSTRLLFEINPAELPGPF